MKREIRLLSSLIILSLCMGSFASCAGGSAVETEIETEVIEETEAAEPTPTSTPTPTPTPTPDPEVNPDFVGKTAEEICDMLTLEEKADQMVQGAIYALSDDDMEENCYSSVLSTYSDVPALSYEEWHDICIEYQNAALLSDTAIPFVYGQDSVHGVNYASGTVIFPQNINIGAANDVELTREMGVIVGSDLSYTGMRWNFAPCVAMSQDPRWGRTYESYSSGRERTTSLSVAFTEGLMSQGVIACAKHFFGDGYAAFGTGESSDGTERLIDRGNAIMTSREIQDNLSVYQALIDAGVQTIMISHTALNGVKMHENSQYISYLKNNMGFDGVVVSDWNSIENTSGETLYDQVVNCINAGIDMLMEDSNYEECRDYIVDGVNNGDISIERVDDAVIRILNMKINAGLFDDPYSENLEPAYEYNSDHGREVARTLAAESFVPIKLTDGTYRLTEGMKVFVTGPAADDTGVQCGGWSTIWNGITDEEYGTKVYPEATTILEGLEQAADEIGFEVITDESRIDECDLVILCVGEKPYAEWNGDAEDLSITGDLALEGNSEAIEFAEESGLPTLTLIVAGRNVIINDYLDEWESVVMLYLPGTETGLAVADVLTGAVPFTGTLPMPYYSTENQITTEGYWLPVGYSAAN